MKYLLAGGVSGVAWFTLPWLSTRTRTLIRTRPFIVLRAAGGISGNTWVIPSIVAGRCSADALVRTTGAWGCTGSASGLVAADGLLLVAAGTGFAFFTGSGELALLSFEGQIAIRERITAAAAARLHQIVRELGGAPGAGSPRKHASIRFRFQRTAGSGFEQLLTISANGPGSCAFSPAPSTCRNRT